METSTYIVMIPWFVNETGGKKDKLFIQNDFVIIITIITVIIIANTWQNSLQSCEPLE